MKKSSPTPLLARFTQLFRKTEGLQPMEAALLAPAQAVTSDSLKGHFRQKRRNDAIRAREFNALRKAIRLSREIPIHEGLDLRAPNSQLRNSNIGDQLTLRSSILDKIDGAEAHLEQWWGNNATPAPKPMVPEQDLIQTAAASLSADDELDLDFTDMQALACDADVEAASADSNLRDAALLFAEGELEAAEAALLGLLETSGQDSDSAEMLTAALFDVYRCSGQQDRYEALALDYANRYGRSPPEWFLLQDAAALATGHSSGAKGTSASWKCPPILDAKALSMYVAQHPANAAICAINWQALQHIDSSVAGVFAKQVAAWCDSTAELNWSGIDGLLAALKMCRVSGNEAISQPWWLIQLDVLRLLHREQDFEELALEYCVTYEVSPPSWSPARSRLTLADKAPKSAEFPTTVPANTFEERDAQQGFASFALEGNVTGDSASALMRLRESTAGASQITISCARLGRIDFVAAATLMGWVRECNARGCQVQFVMLPRLVLVYFQMLSMETCAALSTGPR